MSKRSKMIKIPSRGIVITSRGRTVTPINRPYRESVDVIRRMLSSDPKPTILEVLGNGRTVELTSANYDADNELVKPDISPVSITPSVNNYENKKDEEPKDPDKTPEEPQQQASPVEKTDDQETQGDMVAEGKIVDADPTAETSIIETPASTTEEMNSQEATQSEDDLSENKKDEEPKDPDKTPEEPQQQASPVEKTNYNKNNKKQNKGKGNKQQNVAVNPEPVK